MLSTSYLTSGDLEEIINSKEFKIWHFTVLILAFVEDLN